MNELCLRCLVQVELQKVTWKYDEIREIGLRGPPVFLKLSMLGMTRSSNLFRPTFPLRFNHSMTFDRVFTNCKLQSLLPELLRDEQVKLELIQIKPDYDGGKILGSYETSCYSFLNLNEQIVTLRKSRRYNYPPSVHLTSTVAISNSIIKSPVAIIRRQSIDPAARLNTAINSTQDTLKSIHTATPTAPPTATPTPLVKPFATSTPTRSRLLTTGGGGSTSVIHKYLPRPQPRPSPSSTSPYQLVQQKVDKVLTHYWDSKVESASVDSDGSVGDDEDLIRESFAAERDQTLNRSSHTHRNDSLLTKLGPTDYWSTQLAEHSNGGDHRQVFSETMEKIYNRLYHKSLQQ